MMNHHYKVLQTMQRGGLLGKQAVLSIKGQLHSMTEDEREVYLKKIIAGRRKHGHSQQRR